MRNFQERGNVRNSRKDFVFLPAEEGRMVKMTISFRDGGMNMFDYKNEARGIQLVVTVVNVTNYPGGRMEQSSPMSDTNFRVLLQPLGRYNKKKMDEMVDSFDDFAPEFARLWLEDDTRYEARELLIEKLKEVGSPVAA